MTRDEVKQEIARRLAAKRALRAKAKHATKPRYDDVYWLGVLELMDDWAPVFEALAKQ